MLTLASCDEKNTAPAAAVPQLQQIHGFGKWIKAGATWPDTFRFSVRPGEQCKPNTTECERKYADTAFVDFTIPARTSFEVKSGNQVLTQIGEAAPLGDYQYRKANLDDASGPNPATADRRVGPENAARPRPGAHVVQPYGVQLRDRERLATRDLGTKRAGAGLVRLGQLSQHCRADFLVRQREARLAAAEESAGADGRLPRRRICEVVRRVRALRHVGPLDREDAVGLHVRRSSKQHGTRWLRVSAAVRDQLSVTLFRRHP
jgi:hypothetical protein